MVDPDSRKATTLIDHEDERPEPQDDRGAEGQAGASGGDAVAPATGSPAPEGAAPAPRPSAADRNMQWYVLRVASNLEDRVCEALQRKVKIEHLEDRIGRILVLTAREKRMRGGVAKVVDKKLYPGYVFVEM